MAHPVSIRDMPTEILGLIFENLAKEDLIALPNWLIAKGLSATIAKSTFSIHEVWFSRKSINDLDRISARPYLANMVQKIVLHIEEFKKYLIFSSYELEMMREIESLAKCSRTISQFSHHFESWTWYSSRDEYDFLLVLYGWKLNSDSEKKFCALMEQIHQSPPVRDFHREKKRDASIIKTFLAASRQFPNLKIILVDHMDYLNESRSEVNAEYQYHPVLSLLRALVGAGLQPNLLGRKGEWQRNKKGNRCFPIDESTLSIYE